MCVCQCAHSACVSRAACVRFSRVIVLAGSAHTSPMRASASALQTSAHDGRRCVAAWSEACRHWLFDAKTIPRTSSVRPRPSPSSSISGDRCFRLLAFSNGRGPQLGVRLSFAATLPPRAFDRWLYSRPAVRLSAHSAPNHSYRRSFLAHALSSLDLDRTFAGWRCRTC